MTINGLVLYTGKSAIDNTTDIVVIATGIKVKSNNEKTGDMIQIWILLANEHPSNAINNGNDYGICGNCPHRKQADGIRTCYVTQMALGSVYRAYHKGNYPKFNYAKHSKLFVNRKVRFGAYGDPVNIPYITVQAIAKLADGHTGYTHQWKNNKFDAYKKYFQASCDNLFDYIDASQAGWGTFRVVPQNEVKTVSEIECQGGVKTTCSKCTLCEGSSNKQRHITITAHGSNGDKVSHDRTLSLA